MSLDLEKLNANRDKKLIVAIDCGKGYVKFCYLDPITGKYIKSNIESRVSFGESETGDTVFINGKPHSFKDGDRVVEIDEKTKHSLEHRSLMQYALYLIAEKTHIAKFDVILGCSLDTYRNKMKVQTLKEFMLEEKEVKIEERKTSICISIEDMEIQPETLTSIFSSNVEFAKEYAYIIDIGTLNSQIIPMELGKPLIKQTKVNDLGYDNIIKGISQSFNDVDNANWYNFASVKSYIETNKKDEMFDLAIDEYFANYCKELKKSLKELKCNKLSKIIFTGGSSKRFENHFKKHFTGDNVSFAKDPFYANVLGMHYKGSKLFD